MNPLVKILKSDNLRYFSNSFDFLPHFSQSYRTKMKSEALRLHPSVGISARLIQTAKEVTQEENMSRLMDVVACLGWFAAIIMNMNKF